MQAPVTRARPSLVRHGVDGAREMLLVGGEVPAGRFANNGNETIATEIGHLLETANIVALRKKDGGFGCPLGLSHRCSPRWCETNTRSSAATTKIVVEASLASE